MQRLLIIGKVWPEPSSSAAGSRTLQLIELFLSQSWKISFACAAGESPYQSDLGSLGVDSHTIVLNDSSFDELVRSLQPHVVIFDRFTLEEQFGWRVAEACPGAMRILDTIDLHCLRLARHTALKEKRAFTWKDLASDVAKRELASIYRCDLSLMISGFEMQVLENFFKAGKHLLHYTPFLLDPLTPGQIREWPLFSARAHFVSIGNFLHEPNWDSVLYLKQDIWPLIRKKLPKAELHIYGAYPSQKVFQLHNDKEGFLIKGRAESADEVMRKARINLAALRFGAGMKGKLIDAMQNGTPSITTDVGAESMHGSLPWSGAVENTPEGFAEAAVKHYTDENTWLKAQQYGTAIINQVFSKEEHSQKLVDKMTEIQNNLEEHRLNNFTGAMLMQQTTAATRYMSLWIEAKNRAAGSTGE